jgi:ankyrin repeat protein
VLPGAQDGKTALHEAAAKGHVDVVTLLLQRGADKDAKSSKVSSGDMHAAPRHPRRCAVGVPSL